MFFLKKKILPKKNNFFFYLFFYATFQCGRCSVFKKVLKGFFDPQKVKKRASKVAHNQPRPFFPTVQPRPQPTAQNWCFILWNLGTRYLFSYLWNKLGCFIEFAWLWTLCSFTSPFWIFINLYIIILRNLKYWWRFAWRSKI